MVGGLDGQPASGRAGADAQRGRAGPVHGDAAEAERQRALRHGSRRQQARSLDCGVQQGRVHGEPGGVAALVVGERDLGVHVVAEPPRGPQAAERGSVVDTGRGEVLVAPDQVDRLGTGGRPLPQPVRGPVGVGHRAGGVHCPPGVLAGVDLDLADAVVGGRADPHLHGHLAGGGEHQRGRHGEVVHGGVGRVQDQVDERRPRQHGGGAEGVVGQPRTGGQREDTGEHRATARQLDPCPEQRVR